MKAHQFLHEMVQKFAPMDERTSAELSGKASDEYGKILVSVEKKQTEINLAKQINENLREGQTPEPVPSFTLGEKVVKFLEQWYVQYLIGVLFIIAVPMVRNFINGNAEQEEPQDEFSQFEAWRRFQKFQNGG